MEKTSNFKLQRNSKFQAPTSKEAPNSKLQTLDSWMLGLGAFLDVGAWSLEAFRLRLS